MLAPIVPAPTGPSRFVQCDVSEADLEFPASEGRYLSSKVESIALSSSLTSGDNGLGDIEMAASQLHVNIELQVVPNSLRANAAPSVWDRNKNSCSAVVGDDRVQDKDEPESRLAFVLGCSETHVAEFSRGKSRARDPEEPGFWQFCTVSACARRGLFELD